MAHVLHQVQLDASLVVVGLVEVERGVLWVLIRVFPVQRQVLVLHPILGSARHVHPLLAACTRSLLRASPALLRIGLSTKNDLTTSLIYKRISTASSI